MPPHRPPNGGNNENQVEPTLLAAMTHVLTNMMPTIVAQTVEAMRQESTTNNNNERGNGGASGDAHVWLERFEKHKPQSFTSALTPDEAENWITHIEKLFDALDCPEIFKVKLATYKLEGDADRWWKAFKQAKGGNTYVDTLTWITFREVFFLQYFPDSEKKAYGHEYATICQGDDESTTEFMTRFFRLASFVGVAAGSCSEQAKKFKWALNDRIRPRLINMTFSDVADVANAAKNIEMERKDYLTSKKKGSRKRGRNQSKDVNEWHHSGERKIREINQNCDTRQVNQGDRHHALVTQCTYCGKRHPSNTCCKATGACFACGEVGHLAKDCKQARDATVGENAPKNIDDWVFTLATNEPQGYG